MKRRLLKLGVFLLLGAIVNVTVAWGCALFIDPVSTLRVPPTGYGMRYVAENVSWTARYERKTGVANYSSVFQRSHRGVFDRKKKPENGPDPATLIPISTGMRKASAAFQDGYHWQDVSWGEAAGWPALAMWHLRYHFNDHGDNRTSSGGITLRHLIWTDWGMHGSTNIPRVLPLKLLWPGLAINTIFYAAILWLLWIAPGRIKRFVRIRGHRCPACGFIIAPNTCANGLCSECGARLPWMTKASV